MLEDAAMAQLSDPIQTEDSRLELCCSKGRKCPTIEQIPGGFVLSEHGEAVRLTPEQADMLVRFIVPRLPKT